MDTRTLCLGVLTAGEATGYDIKKCLEEGFGAFLEVSHGSIYPALAALLEEGLVSCTEVRQPTRPDKKVYRITEAGRQAFVEALVRSPGRHKVRSEFIALLVFADFLPRERLTQVLDRRLAELDAQIAYLERVPRQGDTRVGPGFAAGFALAVLTGARDYIRANRARVEAGRDSDRETS